MADWYDVRRVALELTETSERTSRGLLQWRIREKAFARERPLRQADIKALGDDLREAAILGARV